MEDKLKQSRNIALGHNKILYETIILSHIWVVNILYCAYSDCIQHVTKVAHTDFVDFHNIKSQTVKIVIQFVWVGINFHTHARG